VLDVTVRAGPEPPLAAKVPIGRRPANQEVDGAPVVRGGSGDEAGPAALGHQVAADAHGEQQRAEAGDQAGGGTGDGQ
jgi:hypothetical protein